MSYIDLFDISTNLKIIRNDHNKVVLVRPDSVGEWCCAINCHGNDKEEICPVFQKSRKRVEGSETYWKPVEQCISRYIEIICMDEL